MSSLVEPSATPGMPGASLTAVTVIDAVSVAVLKAVVPPFVLTSTLVPALPLVWSQARNVTLAESAFCASGTKRSLSVARSSRADVSETVPTANQLLPPLVEYCQVPLPLVRPVTAMPFDGAGVRRR